MTAASLNAFLDSLPRAEVFRRDRPASAFQACGIVGYHAAVATSLAGALLAGRSLLVTAVLAVVCGASFFLYVYLRRWITGRETLVLQQNVWLAEGLAALVLAAIGAPVLAYMDVASVGICVFLAGGRAACTVGGCCHGRPASIGIRYGGVGSRGGAGRHLAGVRLFPVQPVEGLGLVGIAACGLAALPWAAPGRVFAWFLVAYAVLRFGTEGLRGDRRPHFLGLSRPRWMALAELAFGIWLADGARVPTPVDAALWAILALTLVAALAARHALDPRRQIAAPRHMAELRNAVLASARAAGDDGPGAITTSAGVVAAVSPMEGGAWHVSLSLGAALHDPRLLCQIAARALPELSPQAARLSDSGVLHLSVALDASPLPARAVDGDLDLRLYGCVLRQMERTEEDDAAPAPVQAPAPARRFAPGVPAAAANAYFRGARSAG